MSFPYFSLYGDKRRPKTNIIKKEGISLGKLVSKTTNLERSNFELAMINLAKELHNYTNVTTEFKKNVISEIQALDQLKSMNMKVLAYALVLLKDGQEIINVNTFKDENLKDYFLKLSVRKSEAKKTKKNFELIKMEYKATLFRYIKKVLLFRQARSVQFEQIESFDYEKALEEEAEAENDY
jgi:hypothetical protein